jgi:hypothetical protein
MGSLMLGRLLAEDHLRIHALPPFAVVIVRTICFLLADVMLA